MSNLKAEETKFSSLENIEPLMFKAKHETKVLKNCSIALQLTIFMSWYVEYSDQTRVLQSSFVLKMNFLDLGPSISLQRRIKRRLAVWCTASDTFPRNMNTSSKSFQGTLQYFKFKNGDCDRRVRVQQMTVCLNFLLQNIPRCLSDIRHKGTNFYLLKL